jgi:hypothetical protein
MKLLLVSMLITLASGALGQTGVTSTPAVPNADELPLSGEVDGAYVLDVQVMTASNVGPFTRFAITVPGHSTPFWFYVRSDDNTRAAERGAIVGLLMGVAETYRITEHGDWQHQESTVNFTYATVQGRREIITASLTSKLQH